MWKTFRDFVRLARRTYRLGSLGKAGQIIYEKLQQNNLNPIDVVCYINWADGDCLSQREIGKRLGISYQAVQQRLQRIRKIWPHLFCFGTKPPRTIDRGFVVQKLRLNQLNSTKVTKF